MHLYACVCTRAHARVIKEKAPCSRFSLTLSLRTPYIHMISLLFLTCGTFVLFLICAGDVVVSGASDRAIKTRPLIVT